MADDGEIIPFERPLERLDLGPLPPPRVSEKKAKALFATFLMNYSSHATRKAYKEAVSDFIQTVFVFDLADLCRAQIVYYREVLKSNGLAEKTILKKMAAVAAFCRFLAEENVIDRDITYGVKRPKTVNRMETADISDDDVRKIFECLNPESYVYACHRAILAVGFYTGLRSNEIRQLRIKDWGKVGGLDIFRLTIKGGKIHEIPLHPFVVRALTDHLAVLKEEGFNVDDEEHVLFPSMKTCVNKPMSAQALNYIFNRALEKASISKDSFRRYSPHSMRATFAGHLLNTMGAPLEEVQRAMGHANPTTTQAYNKRLPKHEESPVYRIKF